MNLFTSALMFAAALSAAASPAPESTVPVIEAGGYSCPFCFIGEGGVLTATQCENAPAYPTCFPADMDPNEPISATKVNCLLAEGLPYCVMFAAELWASKAYYTDGMSCGQVPATALADGNVPMPTQCM